MSGSAAEFPTGVVTLMFSDIEGSCEMWEQLREDAKVVLDKHNALIRTVIEKHHGWEVKSEGDAFMVAFASARDGLRCALEIQRGIARADWSPSPRAIRVRIGLHSGEPIIATHPDGARDYFGPVVNRAARIGACAHGGQLVISLATRELAGRSSSPDVTLVDLKLHRLKGLGEAEQLFQVNYDGVHTKFPPLRTLNAVRHNLPVLLTSFVGRAKEIGEVRTLLMKPDTRLVTLHGFSGTGKTRLAQHVAAEVAVPHDGEGESQQLPDGVWFVDLIGFNS